MWSNVVLAPQANASSFVFITFYYKYFRIPHLHHSQLHNKTFISPLHTQTQSPLQFQIQPTPKCLSCHPSSLASFHPHQVKSLIMLKDHHHHHLHLLLQRNQRANQNQRELQLLCRISLSTIIPHACRI